MNRPVASTETVMRKLPTDKSPGPDGFTGEIYRTFRAGVTPLVLTLFQKAAEGGTLPNSFYESTTTTLIPKPDKDVTHKFTISLINTCAKILNTSNHFQQHIKSIIHHSQVGFIPEVQEAFNMCKSTSVIHCISKLKNKDYMIISLLFRHAKSCLDSLQPHELQHARLPYPSPSPRACSNLCPASWWCHPTISSSPLSSPSPPAFSLSQHQGLFQWVSS